MAMIRSRETNPHQIAYCIRRSGLQQLSGCDDITIKGVVPSLNVDHQEFALLLRLHQVLDLFVVDLPAQLTAFFKIDVRRRHSCIAPYGRSKPAGMISMRLSSYSRRQRPDGNRAVVGNFGGEQAAPQQADAD